MISTFCHMRVYFYGLLFSWFLAMYSCRFTCPIILHGARHMRWGKMGLRYLLLVNRAALPCWAPAVRGYFHIIYMAPVIVAALIRLSMQTDLDISRMGWEHFLWGYKHEGCSGDLFTLSTSVTNFLNHERSLLCRLATDLGVTEAFSLFPLALTICIWGDSPHPTAFTPVWEACSNAVRTDPRCLGGTGLPWLLFPKPSGNRFRACVEKAPCLGFL